MIAALDALGFVRAQHRGAECDTAGVRDFGGSAASEPRVPGLPRSDVLGLRAVEILEQADERVLAGFHRRRTETERQHERAVRRREIDFAGDGDVAVLRARVGPAQSLVGLQFLPAIREADEPDRSGEPRRRGRERERVVVALGEQHRRALVVADPRRVAAAAVGQVRRQQHVQTEVSQRALERHETDALQHDVAPRIGQHLLLDSIAAVEGRVANPIRRNAGRHLRRLGAGVPLLFGEVRLAIGHDEAEVARARVIDARIVDLVEDPVAQREPDAAVATDRRAEAALRARRPARRNARPARGKRLRILVIGRSLSSKALDVQHSFIVG